MVERDLAKVEVTSSNLVTRSIHYALFNTGITAMKLYAYGSSFTQGMELCDGDDSDHYKIADKTTWLKDYKYTSEILECERSLSWPKQLADMLGIECENKARSGNSEFGIIHNYTIDLSNDVFDEDDIVIMSASFGSPGNYGFWQSGRYYLQPLRELDTKLYDEMVTSLYDLVGVSTDVIRFYQDLLCIIALCNNRKNTYWMTLPGQIAESIETYLRWHDSDMPQGYSKMFENLDDSKHIPCYFTDIVDFFQDQQDPEWCKDHYKITMPNLEHVHGLCHPKVHKHTELAENIFNTGVLQR